jgi:DNA-directed RNA polymerase subunit K/omega
MYNEHDENIKRQIEELDKVTDPVITSYEYTRLLICRSAMIQWGSPPLIEWNQPFDPIAIAKKEIEERKSTLIIQRCIPDGTKEAGFYPENWEIKNLNIRDS